MIDTEKRGSLYADNPTLLQELPGGYDIVELDQPFHPQIFIEGIESAEKAGYDVVVVDSGSDEWDGPGGCCDIAEAHKNTWNLAKKWNGRMMTRAALSTMHIIWCLRGQDKTKIIDAKKSPSGKQEYIELGLKAVWEKNNFFKVLLAFSVDVDSHKSKLVKGIDGISELFPEARLITKSDGVVVRKWNETGKLVLESEQILRRAKVVAEEGGEAYKWFFQSLTKPQQKELVASPDHEANKARAADVDFELKSANQVEESDAKEPVSTTDPV